MSLVAHHAEAHITFCNRKQPALNLPIVIYTPGWRDAVSEESVQPKNTTQCSRPGLKPRQLVQDMSALIIRTLHIVRGLQRILFFCFNHYIDYNDTVDPHSFILQTCFSSQIIFSRAFCFSHLQWIISNLLLRFCALHVFLFPLKVQDCNKIAPY